jgi:hypothetical protein
MNLEDPKSIPTALAIVFIIKRGEYSRYILS